MHHVIKLFRKCQSRPARGGWIEIAVIGWAAW